MFSWYASNFSLKLLLLLCWLQLLPVYSYTGPCGGAFLSGIALEPRRSRVRFPYLSLTESFRPHYGSGSVYQKFFLVRPVVEADILTNFMCRFSCNLEASAPKNLQGMSRPAQALLHVYNDTFHVPHLLYICT